MMRKYKCRFCSHVYDEATGDAETNIPAGTKFEDIPEDWCCPECGATKADYELGRLIAPAVRAEQRKALCQPRRLNSIYSALYGYRL